MTVAGWTVEMTHSEYDLPRVLPLQADRMLGDDPALTTHILKERGTGTAVTASTASRRLCAGYWTPLMAARWRSRVIPYRKAECPLGVAKASVRGVCILLHRTGLGRIATISTFDLTSVP